MRPCSPPVIPLPTPPPLRCVLVLWRHVVKTGGTSLRHAFERLEMHTAAWSAIGRSADHKLAALPSACVRTAPLYLLRPAVLRAFAACAAAPAGAARWSVEYHIRVDGSRSFGRHAAALLAPHGGGARVLRVTLVREPLAWHAAQWREPSGTPYARLREAARGAAGWNASRFVASLGAAFQFRDLLGESGLEHVLPRREASGRAAPAVAPSRGEGRGPFEATQEEVEALVASFDVIGSTERLAETLLLVCYKAGLSVCPVLETAYARSEASIELQRVWEQQMPPERLLSLIGTTDRRLHAAAVRRLNSDFAGTPLAKCMPRFPTWHGEQDSCPYAFHWDQKFVNGSGPAGYSATSFRKCGLQPSQLPRHNGRARNLSCVPRSNSERDHLS